MSRKHNTKHRRSQSHYPERRDAQPRYVRRIREMDVSDLRRRQQTRQHPVVFVLEDGECKRVGMLREEWRPLASYGENT